VAESLTRGARVVVVTGRLKQRSYTKDEQKRTVIELEVEEIGRSLFCATFRRVFPKSLRREPNHRGRVVGDSGAWVPGAGIGGRVLREPCAEAGRAPGRAATGSLMTLRRFGRACTG
jgi:single-stranded DNA-binding protein